MFGAGRIGTGFSPVAGPVELQVAAEDAAEANAVLLDLCAGTTKTDLEVHSSVSS